jgi:hypothetical protein
VTITPYVVVIRIVLLRLQLNNHDATSGKIVLIEDSESDNYVAIGEVGFRV